VVGTDFPEEGIRLLQGRGIDLTGLQRRNGQTFRWVGEYDFDMNVAHTLDTRLNVFETFHPAIPEHYRDTRFVFLGNIDPELQLEVLRQVPNPHFTALDTMNFWIERKRDELTEVIRNVDAVLINEGEIRQYTGHHSVLAAARKLQTLGPRCIVVKRGEYGAVMFDGDQIFLVPAYPTFDVTDTTGAGDSFAGGFLGYLDSHGSLSPAALRAACVHGTIMASYAVEGFSIEGLRAVTTESLAERYNRLAELTHIEAQVLERSRLVPEGV